MRTSLIVLLVALGIATSAAAGTSAQKASLRVADRDPFTLRGDAFKARERVLVTLSAPATKRKYTRANAAGAFRVAFSDVSATRCDLVRAVAVGGAGSRAMLKLLPAPACSPMRTP